MKMIYAEFPGYRRGYFRLKPVFKCGNECPRCGSKTHVGRTTCEVKILPRFDEMKTDNINKLAKAIGSTSDPFEAARLSTQLLREVDEVIEVLPDKYSVYDVTVPTGIDDMEYCIIARDEEEVNNIIKAKGLMNLDPAFRTTVKKRDYFMGKIFIARS